MSIIYCEVHGRKWDSDFIGMCPSCENEPEDIGIGDLVARLRGIATAYPEDIFGPVTDAEIKEHASLITRNSAAMGRHMGKFLLQAADEIERLRAVLVKIKGESVRARALESAHPEGGQNKSGQWVAESATRSPPPLHLTHRPRLCPRCMGTGMHEVPPDLCMNNGMAICQGCNGVGSV